MKSALDLAGQFFLKMMLGTCLNGGTKKIRGRNLPILNAEHYVNSLSAKVLSYRNRSIDLKSKSIDWFIYDGAFIV